MNQPADESAVTRPTVVSGMGYPNNREEVSPTPIGWQGLENDHLTNVSRETLGGDHDD
ncbi:MAG: hypothetical protein F2536_04365 [Actinobacteria bacterium]|nr:hypothetical protein [Actinomycetota bacterium]MTA90132.1 hypothetical protein [Actinomycetota bacterium]